MTAARRAADSQNPRMKSAGTTSRRGNEVCLVMRSRVGDAPVPGAFHVTVTPIGAVAAASRIRVARVAMAAAIDERPLDAGCRCSLIKCGATVGCDSSYCRRRDDRTAPSGTNVASKHNNPSQSEA
jgi:hypothetical protein